MRWGVLAVVLLAGCGDDVVPLNELPGLTVHTIGKGYDGRALIMASITQLVDHDDPDGPTFEQRLAIHVQGDFAPTVMDTEGYDIGDGGVGTSEATALLDGNEVQVEHRFFGDSMPAPADWSKLDIQQAAADHHHVVVTLREHFRGPWVSTGESKGGVAALVHRRFYPDDVSGTVAYVAPHAVSLADTRFAAYIAGLGTQACATALSALQRAVLSEPRRSQLAASLGVFLGSTLHTEVLGADRVLEITTLETPFTFWQYGSVDRCASIPNVALANDTTVLTFIDTTNFFSLWSDEAIQRDQGYWYAVATQQGYPGVDVSGLESMVRYGDTPTPLQLVTVTTPPQYDPAPMQDVADWVATQARSTVLVYGDADPWTAGAFEVSGSNDTSRHTVPGGNHRSRLGDLPADERDAVVARVRGWGDAAR